MLAAADELLREGRTGTRGWWPRAVAWLLRLELEGLVAAHLSGHGITTEGVSGRAQLLLLRHHLGEEAARDIAAAWYGLSSAGHHHAYELAPTQAELMGWRDVVRRSMATLSD